MSLPSAAIMTDIVQGSYYHDHVSPGHPARTILGIPPSCGGQSHLESDAVSLEEVTNSILGIPPGQPHPAWLQDI